MNKTITMYELLGLVKDGKAPKKIKYENEIYYYHKEDLDYYTDDRKEMKIQLFNNHTNFILNDTIEILEEKKIPEKLEQIMSKKGKYNSIDELAEEVFKAFETIDNLIINQNEIIDYLKSKGE